jgi:hypothetical protein
MLFNSRPIHWYNLLDVHLPGCLDPLPTSLAPYQILDVFHEFQTAPLPPFVDSKPYRYLHRLKTLFPTR